MKEDDVPASPRVNVMSRSREWVLLPFTRWNRSIHLIAMEAISEAQPTR